MTPTELVAARRALELSQARLAHIMGVTECCVANWERERRPIPEWASRMMWLLAERKKGARK